MIIDASVVLAWLIEEPDSAVAEALLFHDMNWRAPAILPVEIGYVLVKRVRRNELTQAGARRAWADFRRLDLDVHDSAGATDSALELALRLGVNLYDCLYLALALEEDDVLVTADQRFVRAVRASVQPALAERVQLLSEAAL